MKKPKKPRDHMRKRKSRHLEVVLTPDAQAILEQVPVTVGVLGAWLRALIQAFTPQGRKVATIVPLFLPDARRLVMVLSETPVADVVVQTPAEYDQYRGIAGLPPVDWQDPQVMTFP